MTSSCGGGKGCETGVTLCQRLHAGSLVLCSQQPYKEVIFKWPHITGRETEAQRGRHLPHSITARKHEYYQPRSVGLGHLPWRHPSDF